MGADAVGPVPAPPRLAASPVGMATKVIGSPQTSLCQEAYNALRRQLRSDPQKLRSGPPSCITATGASCVGRREVHGATRKSSSTCFSRTGVYLNKAEVTHTLHPLQACTQPVVEDKSKCQLGKPLPAPPPLPSRLLVAPVHLGANDASVPCTGMSKLRTSTRTTPFTPLAKPILKPKHTQTFHSKPQVFKAATRCKYHKPSTTNINANERAGIPKVCRNNYRELSAEQRLFLEVAAELTAHSKPHLIKDENEE